MDDEQDTLYRTGDEIGGGRNLDGLRVSRVSLMEPLEGTLQTDGRSSNVPSGKYVYTRESWRTSEVIS